MNRGMAALGIWGSTSSPHKGDLVKSLFLLWGAPFMTGDGPKMVHFGPKLTKYGRLVKVPKWSKMVQKGQDGPKRALKGQKHLG